MKDYLASGGFLIDPPSLRGSHISRLVDNIRTDYHFTADDLDRLLQEMGCKNISKD